MTKRILTTFGAAALLAQGLVFAGCGGSNEPSNTGGAGSSGAGTAGTTGSSTGNAGTTGSAGATGAAGSTGAAGTGGGQVFSPLCAMVMTAAGVEPEKNVSCTAADPALCYRTCGPRSVGYKSETCNGSLYVEGDCAFPSGVDYSCYKIPATISASCPTTIPQASQACDVAECTPCNLNGMYNDSSGAAKVGYCVCQPPNSAGMRRWSCASSTAWPCPSGQGC